MIPVTLNSIAQNALPYLWDREPLTLRVRVENDVVEGLTKREGRRALSSSLRCEMDFSVVVDSEIAAQIKTALNSSSGDLPTRVPFWPGLGDDGSNFSSNQWFRFSVNETPGDVTGYTWHTSAPSLTGQQTRVPTLRGHLVASPSVELLSPRLARVGIRWRESSPASEGLTLPAWSFTAGPTVGSITPKVFPLLADFSSMPTPGAVLLEASREKLGFGRQTGDEVYPQLGVRQPRQAYTFSDESEVSKLLRFFQDRKGMVEPFWLPSWQEDCRLTADTSSGSADVTVSNAAALGTHRYVQFRAADGTEVTRKINSIAGNVLTLSSTPGTLDKSTTIITPLVLVRFASSQLTLSLENVNFGSADIKFEEVPEEYAAASGETRGTTLGALASRAFLYLIESEETYYLTSYESTITYLGNDHLPAILKHGQIQDNPITENSRSNLRLRNDYTLFPGVQLLYQGRLLFPMQVTIYQCDPASPDATGKALFFGKVTRISKDGPFFDLELAGFGTLFERRFPRTLLQIGDNWELFSAANNLSRAAWTFTARATAQSGTVITLDSFTWPGGALPTIGADYFALGYAVRPSTNETIPILTSTARSAGVLTITLATAPTPAWASNESGWSLFPGYDGNFSTADTKFSNKNYFGGFPYAPSTNPTIVRVKQATASTGKK